ncbi:MAG: D-glycero-beta-D-manno-heptose-1,7-bisphosphate 7-phosphatase [Thiotrichales bacterium]|nr:MAG: D-glycero-beta-D-manno-heptose-1,7-bisphosphate 7-phosphatase [Thiotrichales bacterium]
MQHTLIILDRDGVINHDSNAYIKNITEWQPISGSISAIARLKNAGYKVAVATNQAGMKRGLFSEEDLHAMHDKLNILLAAHGVSIDCIRYCPHLPEDNCNCRKPKPGLLQDISQTLSVPLANAYFVGDSAKDIQAAKVVGACPVLVRTGNGLKTFEENSELIKDVLICDDLNSFVNFLLKENQ